MAPSGPRSQRNARNASSTSKPARSGGISKRRAGGPTKTDRDGDLDMDAMAASNGAGRGKPQNNNNTSSAPTGPRRSTRSTTTGGRPPKPTTKAAEMVKRIITGGTGSLSARIGAGIDPSSRHNRASRPINAADTMVLKVGGLKQSRAASNEGGGLKELLAFLERKAASAGKLARTIRIKKSQMKGDFVYITTSKDDAEEILKLNDFMFAGVPITVTEAPEGVPTGLSESSQAIKDQLGAILSSRYSAETKLLNLSNLGDDAGLIEMGFFSASTGATPEKLFRTLMAVLDQIFKTAEAKRENIISVSLAGNNVDDVQQIMSLADTFPDLVNLDLSRNQFKELRALRKWNHRLRRLETLLLNDNPIELAEPTYKEEVLKWYPRLQNLSGIQVRTPEQAAEAEKAQKAPKVFPIPQSGADFRDINRIGEGFITEFIKTYDTDRQGLAAKYYDEHSTFSLAVNTRAPHPPDVKPPSWGGYIKLSRNHAKITTQHARYQRLFCGTALIQNAWQNLPLTQHPDLATQFAKYIIDCHPINGLTDPTGQSPLGVDGMIMTVHGEFDDQDPETTTTSKRSFSRTFLLGPGFPGRNPIRVISDMLSLKTYSPLPGVTAAVAPAVTATVTPATEENQKQQMIIELCKQTGMTPEYSKMCLEVVNWNFDQALMSFNEKKGQLPAEAFVSAPM
ncbi:mRNA export factor mex67 [Xylariales sp. PMI_506]|nr:mRNA export factor mex67 [Xylariales sp. PMI_506]